MTQLVIESLELQHISRIKTLYAKGEIPLSAFIDPLTKKPNDKLLYLPLGRILQEYLGIVITDTDVKIAGGRDLSAALENNEQYLPIVVGVKVDYMIYYFWCGKPFGELVTKRRGTRRPSDFLTEETLLGPKFVLEDPFISRDERLQGEF